MDTDRPENATVLVDTFNLAAVANTDGVETFFLTLRTLLAAPGGELEHPVAFRAAMTRASLVQLSAALNSVLGATALPPSKERN